MDKNEPLKINYEKFVENALRKVVRESLSFIKKNGLNGDTHFYITFNTSFDGVEIDESLKKSNPKEMTIVLQYQFWELEVKDDFFSVVLSFSGKKYFLKIPYNSITHFTDPSEGFGLQFSDLGISDFSGNFEKKKLPPKSKNEDIISKDKININKNEENKLKPTTKKSKNNLKKSTAKIVSLDKFRKTPKK